MGDSDGYERDELDDIIDASDTDTTSSTTTTTSSSSITSSIYDRNPFVLELHDLHKEDSVIERESDVKVKKLKKKPNSPIFIKRTKSSDSSTSEDAALSPSFIDDPNKERFYDAKGSYHTVSGNPLPSNIGETLETQVVSNQLQKSKLLTGPSVERRSRPPLNAITRPVKQPEYTDRVQE